MFNELSVEEVSVKAWQLMDRLRGAISHGQSKLLIAEGDASIYLHAKSDASLVLRLKFDRGRVYDSLPVITFYDGWSTTENHKEATRTWLEKVQTL